ncbi:membrane protein insertion efficiency factor YidD [Candidatus Dependentiae bacterium]|nr:membrane protein insertion efficiency factor YidD [Candidatus Dependentiae bacterium]
MHKADRYIARALCWLLIKSRPLLGPENICPFTIGCTNFAIFNLENQPIPQAFWAISKRLLICNPIGLLMLYLKQKSTRT